MNAPPAFAWRTALASLEAAAAGASGEDVSELAGRLEVLKLRLVLRLQTPAAVPAAEKGDEDRLLDPQQAAALLGVKVSWIYDHSVEFSPIRLPGRLLRFSETRLRRWMRRTALNSETAGHLVMAMKHERTENTANPREGGRHAR